MCTHQDLMSEVSVKEDKTEEANMKPPVCKACGCQCTSCGNESTTYFDLHQQIAELHGQLQRSGSHIASIEHELMGNKQAMDTELIKTKEELNRLRERYDRLLESHKRMQKINHDLEDKLLRLVNQFEVDKLALQKELSTMTNKLVDARMLINELDQESEKYRSDCNMAVQLLQCKPSNFVAQRLNSLPIDLQERVRQHMTHDQIHAAESATSNNNHNAGNGVSQQRLIKVPIATFPPTAMVFSLNQESAKETSPTSQIQSNSDTSVDSDFSKGFVPMSIIARVLSQTGKRNIYPRVYLCQNCKIDVSHTDTGCQVDLLPPRGGGGRTVEICTRSKPQGFVHDPGSRSSKGHLYTATGLGLSPPESDHRMEDISVSGGRFAQARIYHT